MNSLFLFRKNPHYITKSANETEDNLNEMGLVKKKSKEENENKKQSSQCDKTNDAFTISDEYDNLNNGAKQSLVSEQHRAYIFTLSFQIFTSFLSKLKLYL